MVHRENLHFPKGGKLKLESFLQYKDCIFNKVLKILFSLHNNTYTIFSVLQLRIQNRRQQNELNAESGESVCVCLF